MHPDKQSDTYKKVADENFAKLSRANAVLTDPLRRKAYDSHGELGLHLVENAVIDYNDEHEI